MSPSSSKLIPVTIPKAFSRNGRLPPRKNPAISPQPARQRLSLRIRSIDWCSQRPAAQVKSRYPSAAVAPTLISLVRVRTSLSASAPAAVPPITTRKYEIPLPSVMQVKSARPKVAMSAKLGL